MLDTDVKKLSEEITASTSFMSAFHERTRNLITRYTSSYYNKNSTPDIPTSENHAFEVIGYIIPQLVYDNPRVKVMATDPNQQANPRTATSESMVSTMGNVADAIKKYINKWARDNRISQPLTEIAYDFLFRYGVGLTILGDQPGRPAYENITPQQPYLVRIDPELFGFDHQAKTWDPYGTNGPRFMYHLWSADKNDLAQDPSFDTEAVKNMVADKDVGDIQNLFGDIHNRQIYPKPDRQEVLAWDIWIPEEQLDPDPQFNGSWHTLAVFSNGNSINKKMVEIRKPRPAYVAPWGPYSIFGCYHVPNSPIPLGLLTATAEVAEELNAHTVRAAQDAASYKRFAVGNTSNPNDAETVRIVPHGAMALLSNPDITQMEIGGVQRGQYEYIDRKRDHAGRISGIGDAQKAQPDPRVTATAESIAQSSVTARLSYIKRRFTFAATQAIRSAAYYAFYGEDIIQRVESERNSPGGVFRGGLLPGQEDFNFFDLNIEIEPYSMEHTDQTVVQRRMIDTITMAGNLASSMIQFPFVDWVQAGDRLFDVMNMGSMSDLIDKDLLQQMVGINLNHLQDSGVAVVGDTHKNRSSSPVTVVGTPSRETAAELSGNQLL